MFSQLGFNGFIWINENLTFTDPSYSIYMQIHIKCCSKELAIQLMLDGEAGALESAWMVAHRKWAVCLSAAVDYG